MQNLRLSDCNGRSVIVNWKKPDSSSGNLSLTHYTVKYRNLGEENWITSRNIPVDESHYVVSGLTAGISYEFVVFAYNGVLESAISDPIDTNKCPIQPSKYT